MLERIRNVGIVGAGTMGIGIAEVAAVHGQNVRLFDLNTEYANSSLQKVMKRFQSRVERGKIKQQEMDQIIDRIQIVENLSDLSDSDLVIEAIVENLKIKQKLFEELEALCSKNTILASNTSSISITAIASALNNPGRMIGLHFFNPAPIMKLVEVIRGLKSSSQTIQTGMDLCQFWNKIAVEANSTPGFIVNRVARPFYGEALKMLQEGLVSTHLIDQCMRNAGFRMGPFQLMDLIGIDVNLAVSKTVYETMYYDPRYKPSLIQQEMVYANQLGKKSGRGFYNYEGNSKAESNKLKFSVKKNPPQKIYLNENVNTPLSEFVKNSIKGSTIEVANHEDQAELMVDDCAISLANGSRCSDLRKVDSTKHFCQVDLVLDFAQCEFIGLSFNTDCPIEIQNKVIGLFQSLGKNVIVLDDTVGLVVMRVVSMLINEAADAIDQQVCSEQAVDLAMKNGVNYPIGLLEWSELIGHQRVLRVLDSLIHWYGDDRYRAASWLRKK